MHHAYAHPPTAPPPWPPQACVGCKSDHVDDDSSWGREDGGHDAPQRVSEVNHNCRVYDFRRVLGWESTGKQCIVSICGYSVCTINT